MIKITPLGGLGEIGSNMVCWSEANHGFIVDCGILFPYEELFDINYLIPSFDHLDPNIFKNVIITHAHEDHIGALAHLVLWNPNIVIHASNYAKLMIKKRLDEHNLVAKFKELDESEIKIGPWKIHALDINHSTPETKCLVIGHAKQSVGFCYASDFKINLKPVDGPSFKPSRVKKLMSSYALRMGMLDSTNILNDGKTPDEGSLLKDLESILSKKGRCFITFFTSNICRLNNIVHLSKKHKKTICVMGRSVWNTVHVSVDSGLAVFEKTDFYAAEDLPNVDDENLVFIVSGCQGDFKSALRRISYGEDPQVKLASGDRFIFSSKVIPGNEDKIGRIYNKLTTLGVEIITAYDKNIHCSGHPGQEDLKMFIEQCDFTHYVPVHGETYFLHKHKDFIARKFPQIEVNILNNGEEMIIHRPDRDHLIETRQNLSWKEPRLIMSKLLEIERSQISQRRKMASTGVVFITMGDKRNLWKCSFQGLPLLLEQKKEEILDVLFQIASKEGKGKNKSELSEQIRIKMRNLINAQIGVKPVCIVH